MDAGPEAIIVIPCYNEAERLDAEAITGFIQAHENVAFILVNDGSRDSTLRVLMGIQASCPGRIRVHNLEKNHGKSEAVRRGVREAVGLDPKYIGYWDADLATPLEVIPAFLGILGDPRVNAVFGSRIRLLGRSIRRRPGRHYSGRLFATVASALLKLSVYDTQCGAKIFRNTTALRTVFEVPFETRWIFDVEIIARFLALERLGGTPAKTFENSTVEYPLTAWSDIPGSKLGFRHVLGAGLDLLRIYRFTRYQYEQWGRTANVAHVSHESGPPRPDADVASGSGARQSVIAHEGREVQCGSLDGMNHAEKPERKNTAPLEERDGGL